MIEDPRLEQDAHDFNTLSSYLARRGVPRLEGSHFDLAILAGNAVLECARVATEALRWEIVPEVLLSGGVGHSTPFLYEAASAFLARTVDGSEAEVLADVMAAMGAPRERLLLETRSTNCGANAFESRKVLHVAGREPRSILLVQDPTMQLRTHASFRKAFDEDPQVRFTSFAPFVPRVSLGTEGLCLVNEGVLGLWPFERFASLVLGEIPRLRNDANGYGPRGKGFIGLVEVPVSVEEAFERLMGRYDSALSSRQ